MLKREVVRMPARSESRSASSRVRTRSRGNVGSNAAAERVVLRGGETVVIRPLISGDEAAVAGWFEALSAETRYARFLSCQKRLDRRTQSDLATVDHFDREAVAAVATDGSTIGIAGYTRVGTSSTAELAVAVADSWLGQGIATMLLERVTALARTRGFGCFTALCLASNHPVIRLLSRLGPTTVGAADVGLVELRIDLNSTRAAPRPSI